MRQVILLHAFIIPGSSVRSRGLSESLTLNVDIHARMQAVSTKAHAFGFEIWKVPKCKTDRLLPPPPIIPFEISELPCHDSSQPHIYKVPGTVPKIPEQQNDKTDNSGECKRGSTTFLGQLKSFKARSGRYAVVTNFSFEIARLASKAKCGHDHQNHLVRRSRGRNKKVNCLNYYRFPGLKRANEAKVKPPLLP